MKGAQIKTDKPAGFILRVDDEDGSRTVITEDDEETGLAVGEYGVMPGDQLMVRIAKKLGVDAEAVFDNVPTGEVVNAWVQDAKDNWSPGTAKQYKAVVERFARVLERKMPTEPEPLREYINRFKCEQTRKNVYRVLNVLYEWTSQHYAIPNVLKGVKCPKVDDESNVVSLTLEESGALFGVCGTLNEKGIIGLCLGQGFRINEALSLNVEDVLDGILMVTRKGKRGKKHPVPLHSKLRPVIHQLCKDKLAGEPVFVSQKGARLSYDAATGNRRNTGLIWKLFGRAGVQGRPNAHRLRHTF